MPATPRFRKRNRWPDRSKLVGPRSARRDASGNCSSRATLDIVSDAWAFLIIREAFFGTQTFEASAQRSASRGNLTDRLKKLPQLAIFRQVATGSSFCARSID